MSTPAAVPRHQAQLQEVRATSAFLDACAGRPAAHTPVWFMRQAGRSLPEYRALRETGTILDAIRNPSMAAEITMQPVRRLGVDAAILFSDIMTPLTTTSFGVGIEAGVGPVIERPFALASDLERFDGIEIDTAVPFVFETIDELVEKLEVPLIGFAGAPFTLASYLIEGRPSKAHAKTKVMLNAQPSLFKALLHSLADLQIAYLKAQIAAGVSAVQLFDSWAGVISRDDYINLVFPQTARIFEAIADQGVPTVLFGTGTSELLTTFASSKATVIGADWYLPLAEARSRIGKDRPVQGNLDPVLLLSDWPTVREAADAVLNSNAGAPGHIFNLGHGVLPPTDPTILEQLVKHVHAYTPNG